MHTLEWVRLSPGVKGWIRLTVFREVKSFHDEIWNSSQLAWKVQSSLQPGAAERDPGFIEGFGMKAKNTEVAFHGFGPKPA